MNFSTAWGASTAIYCHHVRPYDSSVGEFQVFICVYVVLLLVATPQDGFQWRGGRLKKLLP